MWVACFVKKYLFLSVICLLLLVSLATLPALAATVTCPSSCSCLLPDEAKTMNYPDYCNGKQAICGYDLQKNEMYCYSNPVTTTIVPVTCPSEYICEPLAKAQADYGAGNYTQYGTLPCGSTQDRSLLKEQVEEYCIAPEKKPEKRITFDTTIEKSGDGGQISGKAVVNTGNITYMQTGTPGNVIPVQDVDSSARDPKGNISSYISGTTHIEDIVQLVLDEMGEDANKELQNAVDELHALNREKSERRDMIEKAKAEEAKMRESLRKEANTPFTPQQGLVESIFSIFFPQKNKGHSCATDRDCPAHFICDQNRCEKEPMSVTSDKKTAAWGDTVNFNGVEITNQVSPVCLNLSGPGLPADGWILADSISPSGDGSWNYQWDTSRPLSPNYTGQAGTYTVWSHIGSCNSDIYMMNEITFTARPVIPNKI